MPEPSIIAINADLAGTKFTVVEVRISQVPPSQLAQMRKSGQIDCGKRQALIPVYVELLQPQTLKRLQDAKLYTPPGVPAMAGAVTEGALTFDQDDGRESAERAAEIVAREETAAGKPTRVGGIDREVPAYS